MIQAEFNITLSKVIAEIDRRCNELTHPIPEDIKVIESKVRTMAKIVTMLQSALAFADTDAKKWKEYVESNLKELKKDEDQETNSKIGEN